jgi:hypothetical protein
MIAGWGPARKVVITKPREKPLQAPARSLTFAAL